MLTLRTASALAVQAATVFTATTASAIEPPGPYVALRVDYFEDKPANAEESSAMRAGEQRGSGVVIAESRNDTWLVLTNAHVVEHEGDTEQTRPNVYAGGMWRPGRVIAADAEADLALIRFAFPQKLKTTPVATTAPEDGTTVQTHGFSGGTKYKFRKSKVRHALPLPEGGEAIAPQRYFLKTKFTPGESGGAVVQGGRLVGLIHGNDLTSGVGLTVDHPSIATFVAPFLKKSQAPAEPRRRDIDSGLDAMEPFAFKPRIR